MCLHIFFKVDSQEESSLVHNEHQENLKSTKGEKIKILYIAIFSESKRVNIWPGIAHLRTRSSKITENLTVLLM